MRGLRQGECTSPADADIKKVLNLHAQHVLIAYRKHPCIYNPSSRWLTAAIRAEFKYLAFPLKTNIPYQSELPPRISEITEYLPSEPLIGNASKH